MPESMMSCQITCQITSVELAQIDQLLARTGQTRSEWLQGLVQAALSETPINVRNLAERVGSLEQTTTRIMALQHQVELLTQQMADPSSRNPSADGAEDPLPLLAQANPPSTSSQPVSPSPSGVSPSDRPSPSMVSSSPTPSIYDVEEDEPDEILYEFLEPEASSPSSFSSSPSSSSSSSANNSIYDAEDEPDEILYDFLEPEDR